MGVETGKRVSTCRVRTKLFGVAAGDALSCAWRAFARLRQGPPAFATCADLDALKPSCPPAPSRLVAIGCGGRKAS